MKQQEKKIEFVTPSVAAVLLEVSATTIRVWLRKKLLPKSKKIRGTRWRVSMQDINDIIDGKISIEGAYNGFRQQYKKREP